MKVGFVVPNSLESGATQTVPGDGVCRMGYKVLVYAPAIVGRPVRSGRRTP
jgi:hypothetical protein